MAKYTVQDLGSRGGDATYAVGLNSLGQVCGYSYHGGSALPFKWSSGTTINIDIFDTDNIIDDKHLFGGINDSGKVVGYALKIDSPGKIYPHAFLLNHDYHEPLDLGDHNSDFPQGQAGTIARGINSAGQVVGDQGSSVSSAFFYNGGALQKSRQGG